jgi:hypothetical protein
VNWSWLSQAKRARRFVELELHFASGLGCDESLSLQSNKTRYGKNAQSDRGLVSRDSRFDRSCPAESHFVHDTSERTRLICGDQNRERIALFR